MLIVGDRLISYPKRGLITGQINIHETDNRGILTITRTDIFPISIPDNSLAPSEESCYVSLEILLDH